MWSAMRHCRGPHGLGRPRSLAPIRNIRLIASSCHDQQRFEASFPCRDGCRTDELGCPPPPGSGVTRSLLLAADLETSTNWSTYWGMGGGAGVDELLHPVASGV